MKKLYIHFRQWRHKAERKDDKVPAESLYLQGDGAQAGIGNGQYRNYGKQTENCSGNTGGGPYDFRRQFFGAEPEGKNARAQADARIRSGERGHIVFRHHQSLEGDIVQKDEGTGMEEILQAGMEFQQNLSLSPCGKEAHRKDRRRARRERFQPQKAGKIHQ